ncbi:MAG: lytic murein transglycosylase [Acidocella sp. 20-57-95]|nr:MAG: lytic murein transglycosylase [Acidocella sp. 20-57-95]HQT64499.1 lytic murein transglycosylase [Acidocella sp.]
MDRRVLLGSVLALSALPLGARAGDFGSYIASLQARAAAAGIPQDIIDQTTQGLVPNADVLRLDKHQPEFTETWATYSSHVLNPTRVAAGRAKAAEDANLLAAVTSQFGIASAALLGIWGIETNFGKTQGNFDVIQALATLAWDRNSSYFTGEAVAAMQIVANGQAPADRLIGSYAGAMGQPQFMPSVYLSTAVSFAGNGRPDIWTNDADSLASMGNYLAKAGWLPGEPSSEPVLAPADLNLAETGRKHEHTIGYWLRLGVQRLPGAPSVRQDSPAALLLPDGIGGEAFLLYRNFGVIRKYNPSDFYALAVGALGRMALV